MKNNEIFNFQRFALLCRQNLIYNYKMILMSVIGYCGGIFILLLFFQSMNDLRTLDQESVYNIFLFTTVILAIVFTGTAFPGLRSKEQSQNYLVNPASILEKFLFEVVYRVGFFIVIVPLLFILVYYIESYFIQLFDNGYEVMGFKFIETRKVFNVPDTAWIDTFIFCCAALIFIIPITGASLFSKYPLIKTLFSIALIIFLNVFLVIFFLEILDFNKYEIEDTMLEKLLKGPESAFRTMSIGGIIACGILLTATYFKLREREV